MAQSLELNIKTTSDVPQATEKAKEAIASLERRAASAKVSPMANAVEQTTSKATSAVGSQFDKIGKAFQNTISSVFLSFAGPLAIVSTIIGFIGNYIAETKQLAQDGLNRIADGKSKMATDEETKMANFFKAKDAREKEEREVAAGRAEMTRRFLTETEEGKKVHEEALRSGRASVTGGVGELSLYGDVQKMALDAFLKSSEGKKYAHIFEAEKATKENSFKAPEGFSNVVGVGANPVLQAMDESLAESKKQTYLLEDIAANQKKGQYDDFTKTELNATRNASVMSSI
jgi:hypothetical protein